MDDQDEQIQRDFDNSIDANTDLDELRNGGPTRTPGAITTTGGTAGPASVAALRAQSRNGASDRADTDDQT